MSVQPGWRERLIAQLHRERHETEMRHAMAIAEIDRAIKFNQDKLDDENEKKNP